MKERLKKKMGKLFEKLNINAIEKTLKSKASEEEVRKELNELGEKISKMASQTTDYEIRFSKYKQEMSRLSVEMARVVEVVASRGESSEGSPTISNFCITCGHREARFLTSAQMVRGNDGRLYYGDPQQPNTPSYGLGTTVYDRIEVANSENKKSGVSFEQKVTRPSTAANGKAVRSR